MGINNSGNAAQLALRILALGDSDIKESLAGSYGIELIKLRLGRRGCSGLVWRGIHGLLQDELGNKGEREKMGQAMRLQPYCRQYREVERKLSVWAG